MAVNKELRADDLNRIVNGVFPTQIEPGSVADRLLVRGREEGRQEGREEGHQEGLQEGLERGELIGKINVLDELLGEQGASSDDLDSRSLRDLQLLVSQLQSRLRSRDD